MEEKELRAACAWNVKMLRRLKGPLRQVQDTTAIEETTGAGVGDDQFQKSVLRVFPVSTNGTDLML
jgi:hypothetical protein